MLKDAFSRLFSVLLAAMLLTGVAVAADQSALDPSEETWNEIRPDLFDEGEIADGSHLMQLKTPYRAHDAAIVPFTFAAKPGIRFKNVAIVIDENPAPLAASFTFGPAAAKQTFTTRFRVDSYSYVRAVAQTEDGKMYMVKNYVKASGGCSAPASKDMDQALASIGKMKFRQFDKPLPTEASAKPAVQPALSSGIAEGQILIRHPNYSGLQMDQVTRLFIPAHFLDEIDILHGDELAMKIEGGISLSEDPNIRFYYHRNGPKTLSIKATDTEQNEFSKTWELNAGT